MNKHRDEVGAFLRTSIDGKRQQELAKSLEQLQSKRRTRVQLGLIAIFFDLACITVGFLIAGFARLAELDGDWLPQLGRILVSISPVYIAVTLNNQTHHVMNILDSFRSAGAAVFALLIAGAAVLLITYFLKAGTEFSRLIFGLGIVLSAVFVAGWRHELARHGRKILGDAPFANLNIYDGVERSLKSGETGVIAQQIGLTSDVNDPVMVDRLGEMAKGLDTIIIHCPPEKRERWAPMLKSLDISSEIVVAEITPLMPLGLVTRGGQASLVLGSGSLAWNQRVIKRTFDLLVSIVALPFLLPVFALVALVMKLDSPGPVLFGQERIGLGNRKFKILKFRSMHVSMEDLTASKQTQRIDDRVTRVGAFIRRTSIDELPQIFNVLRGDMSWVGPRPHAELAVAGHSLYWEVDNAYWQRHVIKPGITGLAQVRGFRGSTFEEQHLRDRLNADLEYVSNWSLLSDIKILIKTVGVVVHKNAF